MKKDLRKVIKDTFRDSIETFLFHVKDLRSHLKDIANINVINDIVRSRLMENLPLLDESAWEEEMKEFFPTKRIAVTSIREKRFNKILIANRGEIALRIIRACKELGIKAAIIYPSSEKDSLAVQLADQAVCVNKTSEELYLDSKTIIDMAKKNHCDAIHPGYGFLAENALFAQMCKEHGIVFIGPTPKAIKVMGNKLEARNKVCKAGIPVIPGSKFPVKRTHIAVAIAKKIGYPIILKSSGGGGGKGMRIVTKEGEMREMLHAARREARSLFHNDEIYVEKFINRPAHIEFQVIADKYGNSVHLGERDCSIQRNHQKLVEEAPSPIITKELREAMGAAAVKVIKLSDYDGVGTIEFILDEKNRFYFIEMNTRIQVEHGITEMITGIDIVKEQIKIASGAVLTTQQKDIKINGWAIECRINAEDPYNDFKPSPGVITKYLRPGGPGVRVCSSSHEGCYISPYYDSMISKLITHGKDREEARMRMIRSLSEYKIYGIKHNISMHQAIMNNPDFKVGKVKTDFLKRSKILTQPPSQQSKHSSDEEKKLAVVIAAVETYLHGSNGSINNEWVLSTQYPAQ